jgi:hypothetical protein
VVNIARFGRQEFLTERWNYGAGEHVTMLAPTQNGKTTTTFDLLKHVPKQKNVPVMLVMKPRDPTVSRGIKALKYRTVRAWPPLPSLWRPKPPGYALWPSHTFDPDKDDVLLKREMRKAVLDCYRKGDVIIVADETYGLVNELKLERELTAVHSRGAGMGVGLWCMTQKPTHIGLWAYSQAEHLFLGYDPDKRARQRFTEIGGVDPDLVEECVKGLGKYEWLYIKRTGPTMCVIEAK